jgi:HAD superfamily hydrolase (TIGR01493 family)
MGVYKAICFDLFDTLITFDVDRYRHSQREAVEAVGLDSQVFLALWDASAEPALQGEFQMMSDRYRHVLNEMHDAEKARNHLPDLLRAEKLSIQNAVQPVEGVADLFQRLLARGKLLALISNASCIGPLIVEIMGWHDYFTEQVFSFSEKVFKPDPAIYLLTTDRLGIQPERSVYVSDGDGAELSGAATAGMDTIRFDPTRQYPDQFLPPGCYDCRCMKTLEKRLFI